MISNEFRLLNPEIIHLEFEDYQVAYQKSEEEIQEAFKWQRYINLLGFLAFCRWLNKKQNNQKIQEDNYCVLSSKQTNNLLVSYVQVGEFKFCLITAETVLNEIFLIPQLVFDSPKLAAHIYVFMEVEEEQEQVLIRGFLRYDQLVKSGRMSNLIANNGVDYQISLYCLDSELDHLLFALQYLEPSAIKLPDSTATDLEQLCSTQAQAELLSVNLKHIKEFINQKVINVAMWLRGNLGDIAQSLQWEQPRPILATGWRSHDDFQPAIQEIQKKGVKIPDEAQASCHNFSLDNIALKLLAATWIIPHQDCTQPLEWILLLILKQESDVLLPEGMQIQISDQFKILADQEIKPQKYSIKRLKGKSEEKFSVNLMLNNYQDKSYFTFDNTEIETISK